MKKLFFLLMICPLMMLTSCKDNKGSNAKEELLLEQEMKATNAQLPMQVDVATTLMSVTIDGDMVTYKYLVDEDAMDYAQFIDQREQFRNDLKKQIVAMSTPNSEMHAFMSLLKVTGKDLRYQYKGNRSGMITTIDFPNDELQEMIKDFNPK